jgi:DNA primase
VGFNPHGYQSIAEIARLKDLNAEALVPQTKELPNDFTLDIPIDSFSWLARGGISVIHARNRGIGWSDRLGRIVLPIYKDGELVYWQARAVTPGQSPKYSNPPVSKSEILYTVGDSRDKSRVVVTEDILSAIRVGAHCPSACILGTKVSDSQARQLAEYDRVSFWLDPDAAGRGGAAAGKRTLGLVTNADIISSDADPKCLSERKIREILQLTPNHRYTT